MRRVLRKLHSLKRKYSQRWIRFWMRRSGLSVSGRFSCKMASLLAGHYKNQLSLAELGPYGFVSSNAIIEHAVLYLNRNIYIGDRVTIFQSYKGGPVVLAEGVHLYSDITVETGEGGKISIGRETHIQSHCSFSAYKGSITIGERVEIAPACAFYPYNHEMAPDRTIRDQPISSTGDIIIGDDVWLGYGSVILQGVRVGNGAVIGAGSIVTKDVPEMAIAAGNPARVIGNRQEKQA